MRRLLRFTDEAEAQLRAIASDASKKGLLKQVRKTLGLLEIDARHPGLHTHEYASFKGVNGERIWEAYAQNATPGAYRVFFHYGPDEGKTGARLPVMTIVTITPHP